ncbi:MAG TPA: hypothetical protein PKO06_08780, partial [Candidatus Ozemobacteraceae bacterium]|nr:hypothetical protein [Candidatus Ozemobacteraceae bacterium]
AFLAASVAWGREFIEPYTQTQLRSAGFSNALISRAARTPGQEYTRSVDARTVRGQGDSLPPISEGGDGAAPAGTDAPATPAPTDSGGTAFPDPLGAPPAPAAAGGSDASTGAGSTAPAPVVAEPAKPPEKEEVKSSKSSSSSSKSSSTKKSGAKKKKKKKSSAPVVSNGAIAVTQAPLLPSPTPYTVGRALPAPPPLAMGSGQEIYSQDPVQLPPVSALPEPSRPTLPPVTRDPIMMTPIGEAVSRVLACNFSGLTGLSMTTSADISREGSFKMGFHTNWFTLDRVYDRPLASNESGDLFEAPIFFNYAVTNDLETAIMLPILNYTVKSRILWSRDFRESGVGDTKLSFKYRIFDNGQYQMRGAFGMGFKFPTGSDAKGLGTGKTDFETFCAFSKNFERIIAHLNLGYVMTGDPNTQFYPDGLADIFYYNIGLEYPHNNNVTIATEIAGQDWGAEGLKLDVIPTLRYTPTENFCFEVAVPVAVTNDQRYGYNYRVTFGVTSFFR